MNAGLQQAFFALVEQERQRQHRKWGDDETNPIAREAFREKFVAILGEEFGEVCRALLEGDEKHAIKEMIECAAVCCRYFELPPRGGSR